MTFDRVYDKLPKSRGGRTVIGAGLIILGLFGFLPILSFLLIPIGIAILAFDHEWARKVLRSVRDFLTRMRQRYEARKAARL